MPKEKPQTEAETALAKIESHAPDSSLQPAPIDFGQILAGVMQHGITAEKVEVVERLTAAALAQQERADAKMFSAALARLQLDVKRVKAQHPVEAKTGEVKYRVVKYHELITEIEPLLRKHAFTLTWTQSYEGDRMTVTAILQHRGYKQANSFTARVGTGPPNTTAYQADGACETYCKGRALRAALNITIESEDTDDPRGLGEPISKAQAEDLRRRVHETGSDEKKFLAFAHAETFEAIMSSRYADLDDNLRRKEKTA